MMHTHAPAWGLEVAIRKPIACNGSMRAVPSSAAASLTLNARKQLRHEAGRAFWSASVAADAAASVRPTISIPIPWFSTLNQALPH